MLKALQSLLKEDIMKKEHRGGGSYGYEGRYNNKAMYRSTIMG